MNYLKANSGKYSGSQISSTHIKNNKGIEDTYDIEMQEFTEPEDAGIKGSKE